jgi:release factor H-coupled RctB family protein
MGTSPAVDGRVPVHAFYSPRSWIEGTATQQLETVAALPGVKAIAAMPDLHPGKWGPVGCSILADRIHPQLVGSDIGCGMGLFQLDLAVRKLRIDRAAERLHALDGAWDGDLAAARAEAGLAATPFDASLGTVGGGNHFCELQAIEEIVEPEVAAQIGLDRSRAFVLVHSGSRGLGYAILQEHVLSARLRHDASGAAALDPLSEPGAAYLARHDLAVRWAALNRRVIALRAAEAARAECQVVADLCHNLVETVDAGVLHRKGTAPADRGLVPIPGSRGTLSYLVEPLRPARPEALASLAHGAGRKYDRASMHGRIRTGKADRAELARNPFGGVVVCADRHLIVEEAPEAYKSIDRVIADLIDFGLARVVATFRPLVTFKTGKAAGAMTGRPARDRNRSEQEERR